MARNHLGALARFMKDEILMTGQPQQESWHMLRLRLGYERGWWVLALSMPVTVPDGWQVEAARAAFGVPAGAVVESNGLNEVVMRWEPEPIGAYHG